jgi:hypothetical protein
MIMLLLTLLVNPAYKHTQSNIFQTPLRNSIKHYASSERFWIFITREDVDCGILDCDGM